MGRWEVKGDGFERVGVVFWYCILVSVMWERGGGFKREGRVLASLTNPRVWHGI